MMYWHFNADAKVAAGRGLGNMQDEIKRKEGVQKKRRGRGGGGIFTNAQERFGRLSKTFIIFDANYQTP